MDILWHGNSPTTTSAYGIQTALFVPRIAALGHDVIINGPFSFSGSPIEWEGFTVLPAARDVAGNDTILAAYEYFKRDLIITLCDPFALLKCAKDLPQANVAHLFPVDCNPLGEADVTVLREGQGTPVAISRFGQRVLRAEGADDSLYAPHGVDTQVFSPGDPQPYRDTVPGITDSTFVIGLCAMNRDKDRKGISEQMLAFTRFHARHPDSFLALHTAQVNNPGLNLPGMAARLGISGAVSFPDSFMYDMNMVTAGQIAAFYRGIDVLSMASYGEGFGMPSLEAQACGVPVITTDGSAMSELCGAGWLVSGTPFWSSGSGAWWVRPDAGDIEQAYETAWQTREAGRMPALKKAAREFALTYDIDRVFGQYMKPVLAELEKRIG